MKDAGLPITLIAIGIIWLVWHMGWMPDKDWLIGIGFIVAGGATLATDGITKNSIVVGPFLAAVGGAWLLRDEYHLQWTMILPLLLILLGTLMLIARLPSIPQARSKQVSKATD